MHKSHVPVKLHSLPEGKSSHVPSSGVTCPLHALLHAASPALQPEAKQPDRSPTSPRRLHCSLFQLTKATGQRSGVPHVDSLRPILGAQGPSPDAQAIGPAGSRAQRLL